MSINANALIHDGAYKDASPMQTVEHIKNILASQGIETEVKWVPSGVPHCYSLNVTVKGTNFNSHGKGVTEEFTLASGYGELMERLQLGRVFKHDQQKGANAADDSNDLRISITELLQRNPKWYATFADIQFRRTGVMLSPEAILARYADAEGKVAVAPYYCINTHRWEYFPSVLLQSVYSTNGCAAGNTKEEALVQAISEIMERHNQLRILSEGIAVPDIPEEVLQSCPIAYEIITFLRNNGFRVIAKDCSLGQKFPVICICLIDTKTGKYHTHFGAFPDFEIALQRTLTESFQGRNLDRIGCSETFYTKQDDPFSLKYIIRELVFGSAEKKPEFFLAPASIPYNQNMGFRGKTNSEMLQDCLDYFIGQGFDVLVRDHSCFGFPTYRVLIPGYSEAFPHRLTPKQDDSRYRDSAARVLRNPSCATMEDIMGFMLHMSMLKESKLAVSFLKETVLPAELDVDEERYLLEASLAYVHYKLGKLPEVLSSLNKMLRICPQKDQGYLICLKRYISLTNSNCSKEEVRSILEYFHDPATVLELYQYVESKQNPFDKLVLHCDQKCSPNCLLYGTCTKKANDKLSQLVNRKTREMDPAKLEEAFMNYC